MATYIHQRALWPDFQWDQNSLSSLIDKGASPNGKTAWSNGEFRF